MFIDEVTVKVEAGNGGDGCLAFRREKYVSMGGPFGGNGGHGSNIKFVVDERTCDGAYYSSIFRKFGFYIKNPDLLLKKGEKVVIDDGIDMKGRKEYEEEITSEINY